MKLEEAIKDMTREELEETLLRINKVHNDFEQFLIKELGRETYYDIAKEFALEKAKSDMKSWGMSDEEIKQYIKYFGQKEKEKN